MKKAYELDNDYILDILEEEEDILMMEINDNLPNEIKFKFAKFIAVRNVIERIKYNTQLV